MELDALDQIGARAFDGYLVRKDLVRRFQPPVPGADLCGRVPARTVLRQHRRGGDPRGLDIVQRQLAKRTVRAGEQELFKARAREEGSVKIIDLVTRPPRCEDRLLPRDPPQPAAQGRPDIGRDGARARANADRRLLRRGQSWSTTPPSRRRRHGRPFGVEAPAGDPALQARRARHVLARARARCTTSEEWKGLPASQCRTRARGSRVSAKRRRSFCG
jgi:ATP-dependent Lon protease